jgi:hypothetical protein
MDSKLPNYFLLIFFLQSLGASCSHFFAISLVLALSPLNVVVLSEFEGKCLEQNATEKESSRFCSNFVFILSCLKHCGLNTATVLCEKKEKPSSFFSSAGGWRVLGPCVVVYSFFPFSLY